VKRRDGTRGTHLLLLGGVDVPQWGVERRLALVRLWLNPADRPAAPDSHRLPLPLPTAALLLLMHQPEWGVYVLTGECCLCAGWGDKAK
jgi:hypothetical protein